MEDINIEDIMQKIRTEIKEKGLTDSELGFNSVVSASAGTGIEYSQSRYADVLDMADSDRMVMSYRDVYGNPLAKFIKKLNRRLIAFYIEAIVDDQNKYNSEIYNTLLMNYSRFNEEDARLSAVEKKLYESEKEIERLKSKIEELSK